MGWENCLPREAREGARGVDAFGQAHEGYGQRPLVQEGDQVFRIAIEAIESEASLPAGVRCFTRR